MLYLLVVQNVPPLRSVQALTSLRRNPGYAFLPRDSGEDEGGGLNDLNHLNAGDHSDRFPEIDFDHVWIFRHSCRRAFGDFFAGAQHDNSMRDIE